MKRYGIGFIDIVLIGILLLSLAGYLAVRLSGRRKRSRTGPKIIEVGVADTIGRRWLYKKFTEFTD